MEKESINAINWIEAMQSGNYKQGKKRLGNHELGFCVWGLGCYISNIPYNPMMIWNSELHKHIGFIRMHSKMFPHVNDFYVSLIGLNDDGNWTFKQIANYLIKHADTNFIPNVALEIKKHFNY